MFGIRQSPASAAFIGLIIHKVRSPCSIIYLIFLLGYSTTKYSGLFGPYFPNLKLVLINKNLFRSYLSLSYL